MIYDISVLCSLSFPSFAGFLGSLLCDDGLLDNLFSDGPFGHHLFWCSSLLGGLDDGGSNNSRSYSDSGNNWSGRNCLSFGLLNGLLDGLSNFY